MITDKINKFKKEHKEEHKNKNTRSSATAEIARVVFHKPYIAKTRLLGLH